MIGRRFKVTLGFRITLFDVVGLGVCFVLDVVAFRRESTVALYAVWFLPGIFAA